MQVPLLDLKGQYAPLRAAIETAIREVCDSQRFILGPRVAELERQVAAYSHVEHGIGLASGTDALLVALMALDIGSGRRGHHEPLHVFRDRRRDRALGCAAAVLRHRSADVQPLARRGRGDDRESLRSIGRSPREPPHGRRREGAAAGASVRADGGHGRVHGYRAAASIGRRGGRGASDRRGACRRPARVQHRRCRVPVVLSHEEPGCVRRRRHVRDERQRSRGAPADSPRARRRAEVLSCGDRRQLPPR